MVFLKYPFHHFGTFPLNKVNNQLVDLIPFVFFSISEYFLNLKEHQELMFFHTNRKVVNK